MKDWTEASKEEVKDLQGSIGRITALSRLIEHSSVRFEHMKSVVLAVLGTRISLQ